MSITCAKLVVLDWVAKEIGAFIVVHDPQFRLQ